MTISKRIGFVCGALAFAVASHAGAQATATPAAAQPAAPQAAALPAPAAPAAAPQAVAGNAEAGRHKSSMCVGCHNIPGYKTAFPAVYSVPKIDRQHAGYMVSALRAYKSGERQHPSMRAIAASLSDQDMSDLAAFYASEPTKAAAR